MFYSIFQNIKEEDNVKTIKETDKMFEFKISASVSHYIGQFYVALLAIYSICI